MENIKEFTIERVFDATPELVWKVWTEPEMIKKWWGPNNVIITECQVDPRVDGRFYIVMEAGEAMGTYKGTKWPMLAEFIEVTPHSRLSYKAEAWTEGLKEETMIDQTTEITLTKETGKTKVKIVALIQKTGPKAIMAVQGMEAGFTQQLDKLRDFLATIK
jgi:uncharacterized protein YndB with AHSA1/START domain